MKPLDSMIPLHTPKGWRGAHFMGEVDIRNWGLSVNVRWYPPQYRRRPVVVAIQIGPLVGAVYVGS